jgi:23S rRNA (guanosine2251-2'-O)-methyltransferase
MIAVLHNIRSRHNVGSIFRTADAAGVEKLYLSGITPGPVDRFGRPDEKLTKVSLGSEKSVTWERTASTAALLQALQQKGYKVVALEQHVHSQSLFSLRMSKKDLKKTALLIGPEVHGLSPALLKAADRIVEIPMFGKKESLNVSVAFGILVYKLLDTVH